MLDTQRDVRTKLIGCARCELDHDEVIFKPLTHIIPYFGGPLTHWAPCPTNGQPILMKVIPETWARHA